MASEWVSIISNEDCTDSSREHFYAWLDESPDNLDCYLELCAIHACGASNTSTDRADDMRMTSMRTKRATTRRVRSTYALAASVAGFCLLVASVFLVINQDDTVRYANGEALPKVVRLSDGTSATLDASTVLIERFDEDYRSVTLERGRAVFDVSEDARPLLIKVGGVLVQDIGTIFQVSMSSTGEVNVAVKEGAVKVEHGENLALMIEAGYQVRVGGASELAVQHPLDTKVDFQWASGFLVFDNSLLSDVVTDMNKYSTTKIILADSATSAIRVNGAFRAGNQAGFVAALSQGWNIERRDMPDGRILLTLRHSH